MKNKIKLDKYRRLCFQKYEKQKLLYKLLSNNNNLSINVRFFYLLKLSKLIKNSNSTRIKNRCFITGRSRANYKLFHLSRLQIRELGGFGLLPGLTKSSW